MITYLVYLSSFTLRSLRLRSGSLYQFQQVLLQSSILYQSLKVAEARTGLSLGRVPTDIA
jgi:hypothetical protein